ncbi:MAG: LTA synthase family protein [Rhodanobacteraceae bacterium]
MPTRFMRRPSRFAPTVLVLAPLVFVALSIFRAWRVDTEIGTYTSCRGCFWLPTLGHDAWLLAVILGALAISAFVRWRWLAFVLRLGTGLVLLVYASDLALDALLSTRLHFGDVLRFGKHVDADYSVVRAALTSAQGWWRSGVLAIVVAIAIALLFARARDPKLSRFLAAGAVASIVFSVVVLSRPVRYVNQIYTWNVVETNLPQGRMKTFSPAFIAEQRKRVDAIPKQCSTSPAFDGSVIVLLVESLSAWQSKLLGSSRDWTPELDAIARDNHYFTNFHANGFTTSTAEISVIGAQPPLAPAGKLLIGFDDYADSNGTLPDVAHRSGREAAFFTTGDTSFLDLGAWLGHIGYDVIGNSSDAFYRGMKRWQFSAAEDKALYGRFLDWLGERDASKPFVATLLTVSTHPPYVDPRSDTIDPENAFKYVDHEIANFYRELKQRGFLDHGVLLVLGDHRTMTPLHEEEFAKWGDRAFSRVPFVVAGAVDMPKVIDAPFQQTDIAPSIADLVGLESCTSAFVGHFLRADPKAPDYLLHVRGDERDRLDVYYGTDGVAAFRYDGDASGFGDTSPPNADEVAAWIDVHRDRRPDPTLRARDDAVEH